MFLRVAESKWFENFIYFLICVSSIQLTLENPLLDPKGWESTYLRRVDLAITVLFTFEVIIKVVSYGLLTNGDKSYLLNSWNRLDFLIVIVSIISLAIPVEESESLTALKIIRMARLLRPIRVVSKNDGLRISIQALYVSVPAILNLLVIVLLFMTIFGIIGVNLFKGRFEYCDTSAVVGIGLNKKQQGEVILDNLDCFNFGGTWRTYLTQFNNIGISFDQMIAQAYTVGWANVMYLAMNSKGPNL